METDFQRENNELKARLRTFGAIMRLGRDAFAQPDLASLGVHIVNNPRMLLLYDRSALVDMRGRPRITAEYALPAVNPNTEYAGAVRRFSRLVVRKFETETAPLEIAAGSPLYDELREKDAATVDFLFGEMRGIVVVPLRSSARKGSMKEPFLWILEYKEAAPRHAATSLALLSSDFGNALWSHIGGGFGGRVARSLLRVTFGRVLLVLLIVFLVSLFTVNVEHTVSAEFVVRPQSVHTACAWFDCVVKKCFVNDGERVGKGDPVLEYDTGRMKFQLAASEAQLKEAEAQYETESKAAFTERERLGRLKVLKFKSEQARIAIAEAKWYLANSIVRAAADGILALADGSADKLSGRAMRLGEKLFDILSDDGMIAEIMVNERDASILEGNPRIVLFLHTRPEFPIRVEILSSRFYPELTETNIYSYNVKAKMLTDTAALRYGMRGIARVTGKEVKLGYYLFRGLVLWWRGI